jgi:hypothetical protein
VPVYNEACLASISGDPARALKLLETLRNKNFVRTDLLTTDPDLAAVRNLPGFQPLRTALETRGAELRKRAGEGDWEDAAAGP